MKTSTVGELKVGAKFTFLDGFGINPWNIGEVWMKSRDDEDIVCLVTRTTGKPIQTHARRIRMVKVVGKRRRHRV